MSYVQRWQPYMTNHQICSFVKKEREKKAKQKQMKMQKQRNLLCFCICVVFFLRFSWYHSCTYENV